MGMIVKNIIKVHSIIENSIIFFAMLYKGPVRFLFMGPKIPGGAPVHSPRTSAHAAIGLCSCCGMLTTGLLHATPSVEKVACSHWDAFADSEAEK